MRVTIGRMLPKIKPIERLASQHACVAQILVCCTVLFTLASCSGPSIQVPPTPTRNAAAALAVQSNHHHGETGATGQLVTRYGGDVSVALSTQPLNPQPAVPFTITYMLKDKAGSPMTIDKLQITHEHPMHLIVVSQNLLYFSHIHPADQKDGSYTVAGNVPEKGKYLLFDEFFTKDGTAQIERNVLATTGASSYDTGANLTPDLGHPQQMGELTAVLTPTVEKVRRRLPIAFTLTFSKDGKPVTDLEPYLGAACHVVIISADTKQFAHTHGDVPSGAMSGDMSSMNMGTITMPPPVHFGPAVQFIHTFMQAGLYRVWVQLSYKGKVVTVSSNIQVNK